jgi:60 kDa SS-A/Ro ribonucleoprotein
MSKALKAITVKSNKVTEQSSPKQVPNNGGGFSFKVDAWNRLDRFLIIGTDGGTYYTKQQDLTKQNLDAVKALLVQNPQEVVRRTVDVSVNGRAKSNSQALFVLALAMQLELADKEFIKEAVQKVARTFTHLAEYSMYLKNLGGGGRAKTDSIARWYTSKTDMQLAVQGVKYRNREGYTHRDLMRIAHPKGINPELGKFLKGEEFAVNAVPSIVIGFEKAQRAKSEAELIGIINEYGLPWEAIPTQWHKSLKVWRAIYDAGMGQTALLRNVTRFARLGAFKDLVFAKEYADKLMDQEAILKGRVHPINYLLASVTHERGQQKQEKGLYGYSYMNLVKDWDTNPKILKALQEGFYAAFGNIEPSNKRTVVALDVSGSMGSYANGINLTCAEAGAAIAMFILRTEPYCEVRGFSSHYEDLGLSENDSFDTVLRKTDKWNFGSTNAALPMQYAQRNKQEIDTFVVVTDNEVNQGKHPFRALQDYRNATGIAAREAVFGMTATDFTIADPSDAGSLDFVGFDANAPRVLADFSAGRL